MQNRIEPTFRSKKLAQSVQEKDKTGPMDVRFVGTAGEYFGIWIVNVILSIITIGVYSAWAKVKREVYFKSNTLIGTAPFGYHATGFQIFKGRLIAFVLLVVINIVSTFFPLAAGAAVVILFFLFPVIINNSMRFAARMTSFRNIRFNWHGTYLKSFWYFAIAPIVSVLSLGLLMPLISKSYYAYFANSHSYGTSRFSCEPRARDYYIAFGLGVVLPVILIISAAILFVVTSDIGSYSWAEPLAQLIPAALILAILLGLSVYRVICRNLMLRSMTLLNVATFESKINPLRYVWIRFSNMIVAILTLGLMIPWANVRAHKYLSDCSGVNVTGDLDQFIDEATKNKSSLGEEFAELEGFEVNV